jgi:hypothetical protein
MTYFLSGQWNALCDRCGFQFKSSELREDWQGLMVDAECFERRNPQDFIKIEAETAIPDWTRPEPEDLFLQPASCTLEGTQGTAGRGIAGCMRAGFVTPY